MKTMIVWCVLIFVPTLGNAEAENEAGFRQAVLTTLGESLQKGDLDSSIRLLEQISKSTGLPTEDTRVRLLNLLDTLDAHRQQKSEAWQKVIAEAAKEVGAKVAEKTPAFVGGLVDRSRKMLTVKADYRPQWELDEAAKKARITPQEGKRIVQRVLSLSGGNAQEQAPSVQIPSRIGLVVETKNNFEEFSPVPTWRGFFATGDDMGPARQAVLDISRSVLPSLVRKLAESQFIKWAAEENVSLQKADYQLLLEIRSFGLYAGIRSEWGNIMTPVVKVTVVLQTVGGQNTLFEESVTVQSHIVHDYQDKKPPDMNILYEEIAQESYTLLDGFLAKNRRGQDIPKSPDEKGMQ